MTTADRPWDVRVYLYPGANPAGSIADWGLPVDITDQVKFPGSEGGQSITYRAGRRAESAVSAGAVDASEMGLSLDNKDGRFCSDKVDGPYWPGLDINTPIRMGTITGFDDFNRAANTSLLTATCGQAWTHGASFDGDGTAATATLASANLATRATIDGSASTNFDITVTAWATATATGAALFASVAQYIDADNMVLMGCDFKTDGTVAAKIHHEVAASFNNIAAQDPIPAMTYTPNERFKIRGMRDGSVVAVKIWKEATAEPAAWNATATEVGVVGGDLGMYAWRLTSNTNTGTQIAFDDIEILGYEFTGFVTEWPTEWDMTGRNSWAAIKAAGILRRLRQARTGALQSPLRRQLPFYAPTGYWPMEDGARATSFASAIERVQPAKFSKTTPAADDSLPGTLTAATFNAADATITAFNPGSVNGANGFAVMFLGKLGSNPPTKTRLLSVTTSRGTAARIDCAISHNGTNAITYVDAVTSDGTSLISSSGSIATYTDLTNDWFGFCLKAFLSGGNTVVEFIKYRVGDPGGFFSSDSFATGLTPIARTITVGGTGVDLTGTSIAHLWCGLETLPFISFSFFNAAAAFEGETPEDRIERLGGEAVIPVGIEAGDSGSITLGPQRRLRPVENMQAAADAGFGLLYEAGNGLGFRPRSGRRNPAVLLPLSVASGHLASPPKPVRDDQRIRNRIIVNQDGGSSATSFDQEHIDRVGEYEESTSINVETPLLLQDHADWRLFLGTQAGMRWPDVPLDFARNPSLVPTWRARTYGFRLTVDTGLTQVVGSEPDLFAEGFSASLDPLNWTVSLECSAGHVWDAANYNDPVTGRSKYGPSGAHLDSALTSSATTAYVDTNGETWGSGVTACGIEVGGEQMTVSAVGNPVVDAAGRTTVAGLGSADTGGAYTVSGGVAGNYAVSTGLIRITNASTNVSRMGWLAAQALADVDYYFTTAVSATALTQSILNYGIARLVDASNYYRWEVTFTTGGQVDARIRKVVAGVDTSLSLVSSVVAYAPGTLIRCRAQASGSTLRMKVWLAANAEPSDWSGTATDTTFTAAGFVGVGALTNTGNTNVNPESRFDDLAVINPQKITISARSVNGPVKAHAINAEVGLANQARYGF